MAIKQTIEQVNHEIIENDGAAAAATSFTFEIADESTTKLCLFLQPSSVQRGHNQVCSFSSASRGLSNHRTRIC